MLRRADNQRDGATAEGRQPSRPATAPAGAVAGPLALQRQAGNRATVAVLQRDADTAQADPVARDMGRLRQRLDRIDALKADTTLWGLFERYVKALLANETTTAVATLDAVLDRLDAVRAFGIPYHQHNTWWAKGDDALSSEADRRTREVHLWSKMTQLGAMKAAEASGISLEGSLGGWIFDGLQWGVDFQTSDGMKYQWSAISSRFVSHAGRKGPAARGGMPELPVTVHAHVLIGIPPTSVLASKEWPRVEKKIAEGLVDQVVVHRYLMADIHGSVKLHDKTALSAGQFQLFLRSGRLAQDDADGPVEELATLATPAGARRLVATNRVFAQGATGPVKDRALSPVYTAKQNLVQSGQMRALHDYEEQLWAKGDADAYTARLDAVARDFGPEQVG